MFSLTPDITVREIVCINYCSLQKSLTSYFTTFPFDRIFTPTKPLHYSTTLRPLSWRVTIRLRPLSLARSYYHHIQPFPYIKVAKKYYNTFNSLIFDIYCDIPIIMIGVSNEFFFQYFNHVPIRFY